MQAIFRHLGAALICATVVYLGGVSAGIFAASVTGAAISIVITIFGAASAEKFRTGAHQQSHYSNPTYPNRYGYGQQVQQRQHVQQVQAPVAADSTAATVRLLKISLVGAICGLAAVKETWFMILDMNYTFRGTPWWAFVFYIFAAFAAWAIVCSKDMRRIVLGECHNGECERMTHAVCHVLAVVALLSLAFNVTDAAVLSFWMVLPAAVALSLLISFAAIADGVKAGVVFSRHQVIRLRQRFMPQPEPEQKPAARNYGDWNR